MADSQSLFDTLAGSFGHGVDRNGLNAFVANSQATNGLRTAQTDEALNNAQKQQEELQAHSDLEGALMSAKDESGRSYLTPSAAHLVKTELVSGFGNAQNVMQALNEAQKVHNTGVIGDPNQLGAPTQTAAQQGLSGKVAEPVAVPDQYTTLPGAAPVNVGTTPLGAAKIQNLKSTADLHQTQADAGGFRPPPAGGASSMSDDALYNAAVKFNQFGVLPSLGMGAGGDRGKILTYAANLSHNPNWQPDSWTAAAGGAGSPAASSAGAPPSIAVPPGHPSLTDASNAAAAPTDAKAQGAALTDMTKRTAVADSSEQTALKNLQVARETLAQADQFGSPLANTIVNKVRSGMFGDPQVSAYQNAISTARNEYARVISMATGAQGITDHAMREGQKLFPDDLAPAQFEANFAVAQREMANRTGSMHDQISGMKKGLHTPAGQTSAPAATGGNLPAYPDEAAALAAGHKAGDRVVIGGVTGTLQ